jgi:ribosomal protein L11 methylase PrmA
VEDRTNLVPLQLQGGIVFGNGEHPMAQLCLEWLHNVVVAQLSKAPTIPITVLDYGSGSGVLHMGGTEACALLRAINAIEINIDVDAYCIAYANATTNQLPMRSYLPPPETTDAQSKSLFLKAHTYATKQLAERGESGRSIGATVVGTGTTCSVSGYEWHSTTTRGNGH